MNAIVSPLVVCYGLGVLDAAAEVLAMRRVLRGLERHLGNDLVKLARVGLPHMPPCSVRGIYLNLSVLLLRIYVIATETRETK